MSKHTQTTYKQACDLFDTFRKSYKLSSTFPAPLFQWEMFISFLFQKGYAYNTASTYVSALRFHHKILGLPDFSAEIKISKMLEGYKRSRSSVDSRFPITFEILIKICTQLHSVCYSDYEVVLFRAAYTLAFFGLFRVSELVVSTTDHLPSPLILTDIQMESNKFTVRLRRSKTNQCGPPQFVSVFAIGGTSCPVSTMKTYLQIRPKSTSHQYLFCHSDGKPLTRYQFGAVLTKVVQSAKLQGGKQYKTHSFRIGAATWLHQKGIASDIIKRMGRWSSNAFQRYIR